VENLHGVPKTMAKDWLQAAKERLTLEQALRQVPNDSPALSVVLILQIDYR